MQAFEATRYYFDQAANRLDPQPRNGDRKLRSLVFDGIEPVAIGARFLQQPIARA